MWEVVPEEGDRLLLCSDGLTNEVPVERITEVLSARADPQEAAETLVSLANQAGGNDNITVVVVDVLVGRAAPGRGRRTRHVGEAALGAAAWASAAPDGGAVAPAPPGVDRCQSPPSRRGRCARAGPPRGRSPPTAPARPWSAVSAPDTTLDRPPSRRIDPHTGAAHSPAHHLPRGAVLSLVLGGPGLRRLRRTVRWYVRQLRTSCGFSHNQVVIYQGRPGGFVGINPKIVKRTQVTAGQVPSYRVLRSSKVTWRSRPAAAARVRARACQQSVCAVQQPARLLLDT